MNVLLPLAACLFLGGEAPPPQAGSVPKTVSTSANGWALYRFETAGFSVELPATPKVDETPWDPWLMETLSDWEAYVVGGRAALIQILAQRFWEPIPLTVRAVARSFIQGFRRSPGMDDTSSKIEAVDLEGAKAVTVTLYTFLPDKIMQTKALIVVRGKQALTVACTYEPEGPGKGWTIFDRMVRSFSLAEPTLTRSPID